MNAIEQKLLNKYQQFVDKNGTHTPIAVNVLVRYANGVISEDCIFMFFYIFIETNIVII